MISSKKKILLIFALTSTYILMSSVHVSMQVPNNNQEVVINKANLNVVTSLSMVGDWVSQVAGDNAEVTSIVTGLEDPHTYEPKPAEIEAVANADLFVTLGIVGLEPWVQSVIDANSNLENKTLSLVESSMIKYDAVWGQDNGHIWMDPSNAKVFVNIISSKLVEIDSSNAAAYTTNRDAYLNILDGLLTDIQEAKTELAGLKVIVHHPSFMYFLDLLEIDRLGIIEEVHGSEPSPQHIEDLIIAMEDAGEGIIIQQVNMDDKEVVELAKETHWKIVDLTPLLGSYDFPVLGQRKIDTYQSLIEFNLEALKSENYREPSTQETTIPSFGIITAIGGLTTLGVVIIMRSKRK